MLQKGFILIAFLCLGTVLGSRVRRHLVFTEGSRVFKFRGRGGNMDPVTVFHLQKLNSVKNEKVKDIFHVNVRDNLFNYSDFFAEVFGFKIDWNLPSNLVDGTKKKIQRRDLYQGIENFLHRQNLNGTACIEKFLCEASIILPGSDHFLAQLYQVIFSAKNTYINEISDKACVEILQTATEQSCPLSLIPIFSKSESNFLIY